MKKLIVAAALALSASSAFALANAHNLTIATASHGAGTNGTCQYCHAAHLWTSVAAFDGVAPLWNRNDVGTITPYSSTTLSTTLVASDIGPNSRTCLSCHDGISNLGAVLNGAIAGDLAAPLPGPAFVTGLVLTNDHPVGVTYAAGTFYAPNATVLVSLKLPAGKVECSSCHEPHDTATNLLRLPVASLCGTCHLK